MKSKKPDPQPPAKQAPPLLPTLLERTQEELKANIPGRELACAEEICRRAVLKGENINRMTLVDPDYGQTTAWRWLCWKSARYRDLKGLSEKLNAIRAEVALQRLEVIAENKTQLAAAVRANEMILKATHPAFGSGEGGGQGSRPMVVVNLANIFGGKSAKKDLEID